VRFCAGYTADPVVAEDLAQRTLLVAWRHEQQLRDPQARPAWLFTIARRECQSWAREQAGARLVGLETLDEGEHAGLLADRFDLELEVARDDLARLLDRAMALLPPHLREVLVRRYIEESPQAQIAAQLGLSEGAIEARLHRGKLALKRVLATELCDESVALGLISPAAAGWVETRVWCPGCGGRKLEGWFRPALGRLYLRCPACSYVEGEDDSDTHFIHAEGKYLQNLHSYKPAMSRVLDGIHEMYRVQARGGATPCPQCGQWLRIARGTPPWHADRGEDDGSVYVGHPGCGVFDWESWHALTWSLPAVRRFWSEHPRMRFLAPREVEHGGSRAVVTGFASLTGADRVEVVSLRDTLEVVHIAGTTGTAGDG
jgi:RNA polymerase sigma-70 factor (ECF subfamily)